MAVKGDIDIASVEQLDKAIREVLDDKTSNLVIDLNETSFMDSTGLKSLISADQEFETRGRSLAIAIEGGPIWRLFDLSGVDSRLRLVSRAEEVVSSQS